MKKLYLLIFPLLFVINSPECFSQGKARILKPKLELKGNQIKITYDIENDNVDEEFNVWIEISDSNGKPINARTFTGDIGNRISGGRGKEVIWSFETDGISLDVGIYVQIFADPIESPALEETIDKESSMKKISTTGIVLQSLVLPGLGLSRATGQPHWIRGVAGYTCLASAIALNRLSDSNYNSYLYELDINTRNELFETSVTQDNISEVLVYTALGIWITDIIWNIVGSSNLNNPRYGQFKGFSIEPLIELRIQAPMVALRYTF